MTTVKMAEVEPKSLQMIDDTVYLNPNRPRRRVNESLTWSKQLAHGTMTLMGK